LCSKEYRILSPVGEKELGKYGFKAVLTKAAKRIEIVEFLSMDYRGKRAAYKSAVVYSSNPAIIPEKGAAETRIDGKVCMKGTVTFSDKTYSYECTGFTNERTGEALDPPRKFEKKDVPTPQGVLIFQSAVPTIAPRILPKEGELKNVVFVEFPDDIGAPELITFKTGHRLVREAADEKGEYIIKLYAANSKESIFHVRFDKDDRVLLIEDRGMKLVEVTKGAATTAPADPAT